MEQSAWIRFLDHFAKNQPNMGVLRSSLLQLKPKTLSDGLLTLACDNNAMRLFLEKRLPLVEEMLTVYMKQPVTISLVVEEKKRREKEAPLLSFQPTAGDAYAKAGLFQKYRFDNFAVSSTNQVAFAAGQAVAKNPGSAYNPLFLYGGVGVGKTHLAQAVGREILEADPQKRAVFCPGDQFTNELIESIRDKSTGRFRKKYRGIGLLIVDDIQFIAGKEHIQEEFFHTFNSVVSAGGQIILTSDRPPSSIKNLEDRLRSRFSGGLIVDIQPPDFELRSAILLIKAQEKNIEIDMPAAQTIAERVGDSRALEGALLSVYAKTLGRKDRIDMEAVDAFFSEKIEAAAKKLSPHDIIKAVCSHYNVRQSQLKGPQRHDGIALPRQVAMFLLRRELKLKYEEIAYLLKRKDHTTVLHGENKINELLGKNPLFKQEVDRIVSTFAPST